MTGFKSLLAVGASALLTTASASAVLGFNSASSKSDGSPKTQADFEAEFRLGANLQGAPVQMNSVRLYTNIQGGTTNSPLSAFPAAIATNTTLLLGIWTSGTTTIQNELTALGAGIEQYGDAFASLVVGISVGSEDLYRNSVTGVANKAGIGADPAVVAGFIEETKNFLSSTKLSHVPVGHVDTYNVWGNSSNKAVLDASDFLGIDAYPFYESDKGDNSIDQALTLWDRAIAETFQVSGDKPVWITETGWPYKGATWGQAIPSVENAKRFWDEVGCPLFGVNNTWWYVLLDENPQDTANFSVSLEGTTTPAWNLTCPAVTRSSAQSSQNSTSGNSTETGSASGTGTGTGSNSGSGTGTNTGSGANSSSTRLGAASFLVPQTLGMLLIAGFVATIIL